MISDKASVYSSSSNTTWRFRDFSGAAIPCPEVDMGKGGKGKPSDDSHLLLPITGNVNQTLPYLNKVCDIIVKTQMTTLVTALVQQRELCQTNPAYR